MLMMGREAGNDPVVAQSSIALLQERFRQLQRAKEMREERELYRLFLSETKLSSLNNNCIPTTSLHRYDHETAGSGLCIHPDQPLLQPRPPQQPPISLATLSLSLWPDLNMQSNKHGGFRHEYVEAAPLLMGLWPRETPSSLASLDTRFDEDPVDTDGVDTSLHL